MKKLNKFCAILFAMLGVSTLSAQTDVTDQYLTNADFSQGDVATGTYVYGYGKDGSPYGLQEVTGWSSYVIAGDNNDASYPNSGMAGAILAYGSSTALKGNNKSAPTTNPNGGTDGNCLGFMAVWGCGGYYYQNVTLEAGVYTFETKIYNQSGTQDNTSYIGFIAENGTSYVVATNPTVGQWSTQTVSFGITTATKGKIVVGYQSIGSGSGANPHIFIDGITLTYKTFDDVSAENPVDVTSAIVNPSFETGDMTGWSVPEYSSDTKVWPNSNGTYTTSGVDGSYLFNTWWKGVPITQTVTNLPNGIYQLNVLVASGDGGTSTPDIYLLANGEHSEVNTISDGINSVFHDFSYEFKVLNGQATIGVVGGNDDGTYNADGHWWYKADNFRLTYKGADITLELEALEVNLATAKAIDQTAIPSAMGPILDDAIAAAEEVEQALNPVKAANSNLIAAINIANGALAPYASLKELIALCETYVAESYSLVGTDEVRTSFATAISTAATDGDAATTVEAINTAYTTLESARQEYVKVAIPTEGNSFDVTFLMTNPQVTSATGWTNGGTATGQQYTDAPDNTYLDFYQVTRDMYQTLSGLPNGSYAVKAATRGHDGVSVGYIYVKNGENKVTKDIHKVGNSGNTLGGGWDWTTTDAVSVTDGQLTIGFYAECGTSQWVGADNFTLYRTFDATAMQNALSALKEEAQAIATASEPMNATVEATLNSTITATDATATDAVNLDNMVEALNTAVENAEASIAEYVKLKMYIDMTAVFTDVATYQTKYDNGEYTSDDVEPVRKELNVARYNAASRVFTNKVDVTGWTGDLANVKRNDQHWSGEAIYYYDANSWTDSYIDLKHTLSTTVTLPEGKYVLKAAGRSSSDATLRLNIKNGDTTLETVEYTGKGDLGFGIDTSGAANFSADGTYANGNAGRGWEWEFAQFELDAETEVTLHVEVDYNSIRNRFGSFSDITLWMDDATYVTVYGKELDAPLAEAKTLVNTLPMGEDENTALANAIALGEGEISGPAALNTAVDALKEAVANANTWRSTYNTEKGKLVAALERFEADYNDAENGALDHMAKSRWETVIAKAQAASVAKDDLTSHEGLTTATTELVAALDAATVSVNEYAALDEAIKAATALANGINWGDKPFQRPESAKAGLNTESAQAVYDAAEAEGEDLATVAEALNAAMDITLNVPEGVFYLNVASEGHKLLGNSVVATLGATGDNNPTGYGFSAATATANYGPKAFTFEQVEGNLYSISVLVNGETVYLTYGSLNGSAAGHKDGQIQGNTDKEKAGAFKIEASPAVEGAFRVINTITNTYIACEDGGSLYTNNDTQRADFAIADASTVSVDINIAPENMWSTCVLMFGVTELPEGLRAFKSSELAKGSQSLVLEEVYELEAYTPYILYAQDGYQGTLTGTVDFTNYVAVASDDIALKGAVEQQTITEGYILQNQGSGMKFHKILDSTEFTIPVGKCWLEVNSLDVAVQSVSLKFKEGTTGIEGVALDVEVLNEADGIYTIDGKRVSDMQKGQIYVVGGKKTINR